MSEGSDMKLRSEGGVSLFDKWITEVKRKEFVNNIQIVSHETSPVIQWLKLCSSNARGDIFIRPISQVEKLRLRKVSVFS